MKKFLLASIMLLTTIAAKSQIISGRVLDENSKPMEFTNVVLLSASDSSYVDGAVTKADGTFSITADKTDKMLKVSCVGYATVYVNNLRENIDDIILRPEVNTLDEVVVSGNRPTYKLTGEGISTNVENTMLSKMGTAEDVLAHIPGIIKREGEIEVFGKGRPVIYINGRMVHDYSELDQLKSENIKSVELITSPGARYDASIKAVVKIHTKTIQGEGFGFDVRSSYNQSENTDLVEQVDWNYRHSKLDIFGTIYYGLYNNYHKSSIHTWVDADTLWHQHFFQDSKSESQELRNILGTNYSFDQNNSIGFRYTLKWKLRECDNSKINSDITANNEYFDRLENSINMKRDNKPYHLFNVYYKGKIGETEIDFNTDVLYNKVNDFRTYDEHSNSKESRIVTTEGIERSRLYASKLTAEHPLLGGNLTAGAEYTYTKRNDDYINPEQYVSTSYSTLSESHIAPFIEYSHITPLGMLTAGVRYEWISFDYYENGKHLDEQSRSFSNIFPNISLANQIGNVMMRVAYTAKTRRPNYQQLTNNVTYGNRFLLETGNPYLKHEYIHNVSVAGVWKFMQVSVEYSDRRDAVIKSSEQLEGNSSVTRFSYINNPSLKKISTIVALAPTFGFWSPQLAAGFNKQWLTFDIDNKTYRFNKPFYFLGLTSMFNFGHGWTASTTTSFYSKGNYDNIYNARNVCTVNLNVTKSLLNDRLSVMIGGKDLFKSSKGKVFMNYGNMQLQQSYRNDSREFMLTLRYKVNTTRSKYRGTGAGNSEKERL